MVAGQKAKLPRAFARIRACFLKYAGNPDRGLPKDVPVHHGAGSSVCTCGRV